MRKKTIEYVRNQVGIDLEKYRTDFTRRWENPDEIIAEFREMPRTDWRKIELLASKVHPRIYIESVGVWGKMIRFIE